MDDLISRQAAIDALKQQAKTMSEWSNRYAEQRKGVLTAVNIVEDLSPAQPEQRTGKWVYHIDDLFPAESTQECDQCHSEQPLACDDNYCPNCGAKMK